MTRPTIAIAIAVAVAVLAATRAPARADKPKPAPAPVAWEMQVKLSQPMRVTVDTGAGARTYWYLLYTVTNNTGREVPFLPEIVRVNEIETETTADRAEAEPEKASTLEVDPAIMPHPTVFRAIQSRHAKTHPFLVKPVRAIGPLLQGSDNARTSVAIFPDLDPRVSKFTLYFGGLSGETMNRRNPAYRKAAAVRTGTENDRIENKKYFVLRKTLAVPYTLPGDPKTRPTAEPALGRMTWVMR